MSLSWWIQHLNIPGFNIAQSLFTINPADGDPAPVFVAEIAPFCAIEI
jgi:hypothetical protein